MQTLEEMLEDLDAEIEDLRERMTSAYSGYHDIPAQLQWDLIDLEEQKTQLEELIRERVA